MTLLDAALDCAQRGWHVFPCVARGKEPLYRGAYKSATLDEAIIREWWAKTPDANPALAAGASGLTVVDVDHGLTDAQSVRAFMRARNLPDTLVIRTGRRPEFRVQLYYSGFGGESFNGWSDDEFGGDIRATWGHVMAPGSIHPSGEPYTILWDHPIAPVPDWVRNLKPKHRDSATGKREWALPVHDGDGRDDFLIQQAGRMRNAGADEETILLHLQKINSDPTIMADPKCDEDLERIARSAARYDVPAPDPVVTIGKPTAEPEVVDPWAKYHTLDELMNVPEGKFVVEGILYENSITALAGYAGDRKSIVSLNLAAACVAGQPFMGQFAVANPPKRVIYLCPEMGLRELAKLSKTLGMLPYVGKTLFFRSLDKGGKIKLHDLTPGELDGSLVVLDTAVRFIEGKENDPQDMAAFSEELFRLRADGATVWVLFHSSKASVGQELSLQNAVRGSSEIAAMLSMCWATRLNEPEKRFDSTSRMYPLKVREFEALPFDFACARATAACSIIGEPAPVAVLKNRKADERRLIIRELVQHDPDIGVNRIQAVLRKRTGSGGNAKWVSNEKKLVLRGGGSVLTEA